MLRQILVVAGDAREVALDRIICEDLHRGARLEHHRLRVLEHARADLGPLRLEHERDRLVLSLLERLLQVLDLAVVALVVAGGEVEARHVHARVDQLHDAVDVVGGGAERGDDLGAAGRHVDRLEDAGELDARGGILTDGLRTVYHMSQSIITLRNCKTVKMTSKKRCNGGNQK